MLSERILVIVLLLGGPMCICATGTTILALRTADVVIVLADSKPTYRGSPGAPAVCKIIPLRGAFVAVAGLDHDSRRNFDSKKLAAQAFEPPGTFEEHVTRAVKLVREAGETEMRHLRAEDPATYGFTIRNGSNVVDLLFVAFENDAPKLAARRFHWNESSASIEITGVIDCPGKDCPDGREFVYMGEASVILKFLETQANATLSEKVLRELLLEQTIATPDDVALPVIILRLDSAGARWDENELSCPLTPIESP